EFAHGLSQRAIQKLLLGPLNPRRHRKDAQLSPGASVSNLCIDRLDDTRYSLNTLLIECEASHERVRHLNRADPRDVIDARAAVDEDVIVFALQSLLRLLQHGVAIRHRIELLPIECPNSLRIGRPLLTGKN